MWSHAVKRLWSERDKRQKKGDGKRKQDNNFRLLGSQEGECQEVFQELGACQEVFQELGVCQEGFQELGVCLEECQEGQDGEYLEGCLELEEWVVLMV